MQSLAHLAEQSAEALAWGFNWNVRLNLAENFQNLGVHAMHQLLVGGGANRVSNRTRIRRTVRDYRYPADSEQRRAAVFRRVQPLAHRIEFFPHQQVREPGARVRAEQLAQVAKHERCESFHRLERDVSVESVSDDNIHFGPVDIASLDVAN